MNKKGIIGDMLGMFVSTIIIVVLLIVFILLSGVLKKVEGSGGIVVFDEEKNGVTGMKEYPIRYGALVESRISFLEKEPLEFKIMKGETK
jgi:hypothetical protein